MKSCSRNALGLRLRSSDWLTHSGTALLVSACAHAVAAVTIGVVLHAASPAPAAPPEAVDIDLTPEPAVPSGPGGTIAESAPAQPSSAHAHPRVALARRSMGPSPRGAMGPAAPVLSAPQPSRIVLNAGAVTTGTARAPRPAPSGSAPDIAGGDVASEGEVNVPARLLSSSPLVYPLAARQAEIEIDFPLEIVVDVDGLVLSARAVGHAGYGLDEAAVRAIRAYRFSPALRAGRAVRVRMRWTVQFRLS